MYLNAPRLAGFIEGLSPAAAGSVSSAVALEAGVAKEGSRNSLQDIFSIQRQKGLGDIAAGTRAEAEAIGQAWVNGSKVSRFPLKDGGYGLTDGARTFRLQFKPKDGLWKANFQENTFSSAGSSAETKNVHMLIQDMVVP